MTFAPQQGGVWLLISQMPLLPPAVGLPGVIHVRAWKSSTVPPLVKSKARSLSPAVRLIGQAAVPALWFSSTLPLELPLAVALISAPYRKVLGGLAESSSLYEAIPVKSSLFGTLPLLVKAGQDASSFCPDFHVTSPFAPLLASG